MFTLCKAPFGFIYMTALVFVIEQKLASCLSHAAPSTHDCSSAAGQASKHQAAAQARSPQLS